MLDAHPELAIPPETHFAPDVIAACRSRGRSPERVLETMTSAGRWADFDVDADTLLERLRGLRRLDGGEALRAFYELYAEGRGKPRWGDKTSVGCCPRPASSTSFVTAATSRSHAGSGR
jgi:hypothetical protein